MRLYNLTGSLTLYSARYAFLLEQRQSITYTVDMLLIIEVLVIGKRKTPQLSRRQQTKGEEKGAVELLMNNRPSGPVLVV